MWERSIEDEWKAARRFGLDPSNWKHIEKLQPLVCTYDHVKPHSKGGGTNMKNGAAAHDRCNGKKGSEALGGLRSAKMLEFIERTWR